MTFTYTNFDGKRVEERQPGEEPREPSIFEPHFLNPASPIVEKPQAHADGLLFPGYVNLSGPPKLAKKTFFSIALALHLHGGKSFLGREVEQAECAWLQLDMAEGDFQSYAEKIAFGHEIPERAMPYFFSSKINLAERADWKAFEAALRELKTRVLFLDSSRAVSSVQENESDQVRVLVRELLCGRLRDGLGITSVLISHTAKGQIGPRGSGEWTAGADSEMHFLPDQASGIVKVEGIGRHPAFGFAFELVEVPGVSLLSKALAIREVVPEEQAKRRKSITQEQLLEARRAVEANPHGVTQQSLLDALKAAGMGIQKSKGKELVERLLEGFPDLAYRVEERGNWKRHVVYMNGSHESGNHTPTEPSANATE